MIPNEQFFKELKRLIERINVCLEKPEPEHMGWSLIFKGRMNAFLNHYNNIEKYLEEK